MYSGQQFAILQCLYLIFQNTIEKLPRITKRNTQLTVKGQKKGRLIAYIAMQMALMIFFFLNCLRPIFFITMLTAEYVIRFRIFLLLYKLKKWRPVPVIHAFSTYINTCWTKPNDAGLFGRPITFRMRAKYVAGGRCHLFVYYAMRHNLCSPLHFLLKLGCQKPCCDQARLL